MASVACHLIIFLMLTAAELSESPAAARKPSDLRYAFASLSEHHDQLHSMIWARVIRGGLFMEVDGLAIVVSSLGVQLGHVVNVLLGETAAVVDFGNFCR